VARFLLLHGACHGGWCWEPVSRLLREFGHDVIAPDLPCDDPAAGLDDYADAAVGALPDDDGDLIVVGHSLGGLTVPLVASRAPTQRMVFLAAIIGAPNASLELLADEDGDRDLPLGDGALEFDDRRRFRFTPGGARRLLYRDCSEAAAAAAIARLRYQRSLWREVARFDSWPKTETVSIICDQDRVVNPAWSERVARKRLGVEPVHLPGDHSPFLSRPDQLAALLVDGVTAPRGE
jgi:pimeloyl-ACP methyl ester carboxylesterase